jgi:hypothetical protein
MYLTYVNAECSIACGGRLRHAGMEVEPHLFLTSALDELNNLYTPTALPSAWGPQSRYRLI